MSSNQASKKTHFTVDLLWWRAKAHLNYTHYNTCIRINYIRMMHTCIHYIATSMHVYQCSYTYKGGKYDPYYQYHVSCCKLVLTYIYIRHVLYLNSLICIVTICIGQIELTRHYPSEAGTLPSVLEVFPSTTEAFLCCTLYKCCTY